MGVVNCMNCGEPLQEKEEFCGSCGTPSKPYNGPTIHSYSNQRRQSSPKHTNMPSSRTYSTRLANASSTHHRLPPIQSSTPLNEETDEQSPTMHIIKSRGIGKGLLDLLSRIIGPLLGVGFAILLIWGATSSNIYNASAQFRIEHYCQALTQRDYPTAYNQLLDRITLKNDIQQAQFKNSIETEANPHGGIGKCDVSNVKEVGTLAIGTVVYTYGDQSTSTHQYKLFQNELNTSFSNTWFIDTSYWANPIHQY